MGKPRHPSNAHAQDSRPAEDPFASPSLSSIDTNTDINTDINIDMKMIYPK